MKRKLLSLLLALGLCFGMAAPAWAAETEEPADTSVTKTDEEAPAPTDETAAPADETAAPADETADEGDTVDRAAMAKEAADALFELGLFKGVGANADGTPVYELDRAATRAEAVTMLVRLLGQETAAQAGTWETPFTDVEDWALPYVGYAYANKLTLGTGETTFGSEETVDTAQYITFVLRALGYSSETDFTWDAAWEFSDEIGLTDGFYDEFIMFTRGDTAIVSNNALAITLKESEKTLLTLIQETLAAAAAAAEEAAAADAAAEEPADETTPAEDETTPAEDETTPAEDETTPAEDETTPAA